MFIPDFADDLAEGEAEAENGDLQGDDELDCFLFSMRLVSMHLRICVVKW